MATAFPDRLVSLSGRLAEFAVANAGLLSMVIGVAGAGILAFYVVAVPPGTVSYP